MGRGDSPLVLLAEVHRAPGREKPGLEPLLLMGARLEVSMTIEQYFALDPVTAEQWIKESGPRVWMESPDTGERWNVTRYDLGLLIAAAGNGFKEGRRVALLSYDGGDESYSSAFGFLAAKLAWLAQVRKQDKLITHPVGAIVRLSPWEELAAVRGSLFGGV